MGARSGTSALQFDPFNAEARLQYIMDGLNSRDAGELGALEAEAQRGILFDPGDARLRSALGEIKSRQGNADAALALFLQAHELSQTERHALHVLVRRAIEERNYSEILRLIDVSLRRWPSEFHQFEAILQVLVLDPTTYDAVMAMLNTDPPWRHRFLNSLVSMQEEHPRVVSVLLDLIEGETPPASDEVASLVRQLANRNRYQEAHHLFLFSLSDEEWARVGLLHNGLFAPTSNTQPFDWTYASNAYAEVSLSDRGLPKGGATLRFFNRPARHVNLRQVLVLEPGEYRLRLNVSARSLVAPRGLYWSLRCMNPSDEIVRIDLKQGTYLDKQLDAEFAVTDCPTQIIELRSGLTIDSQRFAYSGSVTFHSMSLERI